MRIAWVLALVLLAPHAASLAAAADPCAPTRTLLPFGITRVEVPVCGAPGLAPPEAPLVTPPPYDCPSPLFNNQPYAWVLPSSYLLNTTMVPTLVPSQVRGALAAAGNAWDDATPQNIFDNVALHDFGWNAGTFDGTSQIAWKTPAQDPNLVTARIAFLYMFVNFQNRILEVDIVFNASAPGGWATSGAGGKWDVGNVGAHALGLSYGLDIVGAFPNSSNNLNRCLTMYSVITNFETQKRSLGVGDQVGILNQYP